MLKNNKNKTGVVTNVFSVLLKRNIPLHEIIRQAQKQQQFPEITYVELRQFSIGKPYESETGVPDVGAIKELALQFKDIQFNLALQCPFFSGTVNATNDIFLKGVACAKVLAEVHGVTPHLRFVDPATPVNKEIPIETVIKNIEEMLTVLADIGGILSLENSSQEKMWQQFWGVVCGVKKHRDKLKVCYDPCNLIKSENMSGDQIATITPIQRNWKSDDISIFHIKQSDGKKVLTVVSDGVLNWKKQIQQLEQMSYTGPICLEIQPSEDVFTNIKQSWDYLLPFFYEFHQRL